MTEIIANPGETGLLPFDDPRLRVPCTPWDFEKNDTETAAKVGTLLIETSNKLGGAGLSANQIGLPHKVFAMTVAETEQYAVFNPEILEVSKDEILAEEGCLSVPGLWIKVKRPAVVKVRYFTFKGEEIKATLSGITSRVFQHEYDHMLGIQFTQRVSKLKFDMAIKKYKKQMMQKAKLTRTMVVRSDGTTAIAEKV
jgi:peptide deformylase